MTRYLAPVVATLITITATAAPAPDRPIRLAALRAGTEAPDARTFRPAAAQSRFTGAAFAHGERDLFLVQLAHGHERKGTEIIETTGGQALGYVPDHAWLCRLGRPALAKLKRDPRIAWVGHHQPLFRIAPRLQVPFRDLEVTVLTARGADADVVLKWLKRAGHPARLIGSLAGRGELRTRLSSTTLPGLAALPQVLWVEPHGIGTFFNDVARSSSDIPTARADGPGPILDVEAVWEKGLRGEGQVVAVMDTGLDAGTIAEAPPRPALHEDFGELGNADNPLRLIATFAPSSFVADMTPDWIDMASHGTPAAASAVGNGIRSGADPANDVYDGSHAGTAPKAMLIAQDIFDDEDLVATGRWIPGELADWGADLFGSAHALGARVQTNSWGTAGLRGAYTVDCLKADRAAWDHPDLALLFAAGNGGSDDSVDLRGPGWTVDGCSSDAVWVQAESYLPPLGGGDCAFRPLDLWMRTEAFWTVNPAACESTHAPDLDACLTSPPIPITPGRPPLELRLTCDIDTEEGADFGVILLDKNDDGVFETEVARLSGPTNGFWSNGRWDLPTSGWGSTARLRFRFTSNASVEGLGWSLYRVSLADGVIDELGVAPPATAKNVISVGMTESYRPPYPSADPCTSLEVDWGGVGPMSRDHWADDASGLAAFSDRGPCEDGRRKPDVVAPGVHVASAQSRGQPMLPPIPSFSNCGMDPAVAPYYAFVSGSSFSTPLTAGVAALVRQYFVDGWHANHSTTTNELPRAVDAFSPSASLVKACLLNGAHSIYPGQFAPPFEQIPEPEPNFASGHGRVDAMASLFPDEGHDFTAARRLRVHDEKTGLTTGESRVYRFALTSTADPLRVTLVWTDPPPTPGAALALVNDLDVSVTLPGGSTLRPGPGGNRDTVDNAESLFIDPTQLSIGQVEVRVEATNVPGNVDLPGSDVQPYALVISGDLTDECPPQGPVRDSLRVALDHSGRDVLLTWGLPEPLGTPVAYRVADFDPESDFTSFSVLDEVPERQLVDAGTANDGRARYYRVAAINDCGAISEY